LENDFQKWKDQADAGGARPKSWGFGMQSSRDRVAVATNASAKNGTTNMNTTAAAVGVKAWKTQTGQAISAAPARAPSEMLLINIPGCTCAAAMS
jgi:hypothetical protein